MGFLQDLQLKGSDPRVATCRGKLQSKRCKLNQEINKELRLRAGAENLYKATTNKKLKDTVALELSFVNSNLQLLKEQLSELNSSVEIYQSEGLDYVIPMIPLGLKETKEVNFMEPFSDFILEHYSEPSHIYEDAIADITDTRQAAKTPTRDAQGVSLLFRYYNLLYYVERRFFPPDRSLGVYFEWYDSLTGVPSCQRTVAFEKACILFNLAAIYTQIGARQDRSSEKGLDAAVDNLLRAAGVFRHIFDTFTNAPSMDLKPQVLEVLVALMLAQARECLFEKLLLQVENLPPGRDCVQNHRDLSGEATQLALEYREIHQIIHSNDAHTYLPECWAGLVPLKSEYYKALAHYHAAKTKVSGPGGTSSTAEDATATNRCNKQQQQQRYGRGLEPKDTFIFDETSFESDLDPVTLRRAHLRESLSSHEEAQRLQRMCRELKNKVALSKVLNYAHERTAEELEELELDRTGTVGSRSHLSALDEPDLDQLDVTLNATSKFTISLTGPDFTMHRCDDPFRKLGPIAIFSARRHWTAPRSVRLQKGGPSFLLGGGTLDRRQSPYGGGAGGSSSSGGNSSSSHSSSSNNRRQQSRSGGRCCGECANKTNYYNDSRACEVCLKDVCNVSEREFRELKLQDGGGGGGGEQQQQQLHGTDGTGAEDGRGDISSFGFNIRGDAPVMISTVEINSLADLGGIKEGDFIVELCGVDVKWYTLQQVLKLIRNCEHSLELKVITPMDRNYLKPMAMSHSSKGSISTLSGSSSGISSGAPSPTGTTTKSATKTRSKLGKTRLSSFTSGSWNPFRRTQSLGKIF
ncbi:rhophilin-2 isoform X2 [Anopheles gambiae]|uniref:rhophilin-2 isoform X2 n=1 Tax=Anopheles gambiae TaxID=7165 RepID=UPI002AC9791F|nr:rhophilin-2 isoform X2 [Anopheles gambiae]XP_061501184.1 rhophilin-2 isoform X2 [Anopheles gambiae]XP_061501194.1 rhophilin-2 isoform X2 [Anopheles gambiae]XP_061501197.1 rhophilin-2 isoform X2 [Anopheles gambiae]XP_061501208.1 rhophilin-2 isoform X2 [Anopheles gambiae]XP_061501217.1 rhophilin-2 isoform X2 [Anopheles gambiae]XP_061501226.1 rhophilin-2 isoform X2 [Anopheles gambiae]XP_061501232.1 rhophilin-2 isoform X2 [Anopheles gambiae]